MANNITQVFEEAGQDAQSLQEFVNNPANLPVNRRLAPPIKPLSHYEQYMDSLASGKDATITSVTAKTGAAGTEASVKIGGTPSARTFEFTIPKGENAENIYQIRRSYQTYELMVADKNNTPANTSIDVTNDEDFSENGTYTYDGETFTKSIHDTQEVLKKAVDDIKEDAAIAFGQAIQEYGYVTVDSFELGATLTQRNQALRHAADGKLYRWAGDLPKVVPANSTPTSTGGFGANAWLEVSDSTLRQELFEALDSTTVFLQADKLGLVQWDEFKKPPYTAQEYTDARQNGIILTSAISRAANNGATEVLLERGRYPLIYRNETGSVDFKTLTYNGTIHLEGLNNITINFNGSTLFTLYDSLNKHQYNTSPTSYKAYELAGTLITMQDSRGVAFKNGVLRGDQYNRAWVAGEEKIEQTVGLRCLANNRHISFFNMKFTGFRADGLSGDPRGEPIAGFEVLYDWEKGGINKDSGAYNPSEVGAYRSSRIDITGNNIIDNRVQLMGHGVKLLPFRSNLIKVFFYDVDNTYLGMSKVGQAEDIYLYPNTAKLQFVVTNDERETPTVRYSTRIRLMTGMSLGFYIDKDCEFFENMRGGISNLGGDTFVDGASFYDMGRLSKLGFLHYGDPTQYAINFEDSYTNRLVVDNIKVRDVPSGVLGCCREFIVKNSNFKGIYWGGIQHYNAIYAEFTNNVIEGDQSSVHGISFIKQDAGVSESSWLVTGNKLIGTGVRINIENTPNMFLTFTNNLIEGGELQLFGDYKNIINEGNTVRNIGITGTKSGGSKSLLQTRGMLNSSHNSIIKQVSGSPSTYYLYHDSLGGTNNLIELPKNYTSRLASQDGQVVSKLNNIRVGTVGSEVGKLDLVVNEDSGVNAGIDTEFLIENVIFDKVVVGTMMASAKNWAGLKIHFKNCQFVNLGRVYLTIRETNSNAKLIIFEDCVFEVFSGRSPVENVYALDSEVSIKFINCTFKSIETVSIELVKGLTNSAQATVVSAGTRLINITDTSVSHTLSADTAKLDS